MYTHTHTRLTALCPGLPGWAGTRKVKPIWTLLKQETVNGSGISWAICKSAPRSRQITMPAPHCSVFYRPDALPAAQPTASKHWRQDFPMYSVLKIARRVITTWLITYNFPGASTKFQEISSISRSNFKFGRFPGVADTLSTPRQHTTLPCTQLQLQQGALAIWTIPLLDHTPFQQPSD